MLITCCDCQTQFLHAMGRCPACGEKIVLTDDMRDQIWKEVATRLFDEGKSREQVLAQMIEEGISDAHAEHLLESIYGKIQAERRTERMLQIRAMIFAGIWLFVVLIPASALLYTGRVKLACLLAALAFVFGLGAFASKARVY